MHGHERNVERKIRLWILLQERNRRKEGQLGQISMRGDEPVERRQRVVNLRQRKL
jgi:hypothetical protein